MSMSRITPSLPRSPRPCPRRFAPPRARSSRSVPGAPQDPARAARIEAQLVGVRGGALHGEVALHRLALAPRPLPGDGAHADHLSLPAETERPHAPVRENGQHVDRIAE